ncbi:DNA-directed RNA polymerase subunit beta, partial [Nocardia sp. 2YAB30]
MLEGRILAVSSQTKVNAGIPVDTGRSGACGATRRHRSGAPNRVSFAKLREPMDVPGLLEVQTDSFDWLIGAPAWREQAAARGNSLAGGLEEVLDEISPIEDFAATMSLTLSEPRFEEAKASIEECKDKDMTYAAPLFVTAEFINNNTGEIKSQTVFMGDFPMMTDKGTFIINGT